MQQRTVPTFNHLSGITQQSHDGEALRRALPLVPAQPSEPKDHFSYLALRRADHAPVKCLQHALGPQSFLAGEAFVGRNRSAVKLREQPVDSIETDERILIKWDDRHKRTGVRIFVQNLKATPSTCIKKMVEAVMGVFGRPFRQDRLFHRAAQDVRNLL